MKQPKPKHIKEAAGVAGGAAASTALYMTATSTAATGLYGAAAFTAGMAALGPLGMAGGIACLGVAGYAGYRGGKHLAKRWLSKHK